LILITGGAGFIGSNFVLHLLNNEVVSERIVVLDNLTYAGNMNNLSSVLNNPNFSFEKCNINNLIDLKKIINKNKPRAIVHFAAESHVDRSIKGPSQFIETNINGTFNLLESSYEYFLTLDNKNMSSKINNNKTTKKEFKFLHVSTDEVYGSLDSKEPGFSENHPYRPNSPYAASKASSDFLVRAWNKTYKLPTLITNCSNNYGPYQFPEKLIPLVILNALDQKPIPIYGNGMQIRDWLYVEDHCKAISLILDQGVVGETYNIGGNCEFKNIELVKKICLILDDLAPVKNPNKIKKYHELIKFVEDRPGHDTRYAIDNQKIRNNLGWKPKETLFSGLDKTIRWYVDNSEWIESIKNDSYRHWMESHYIKNSSKGENESS
jgi:dTDP-glucose 4,6-dehydratase